MIELFRNNLFFNALLLLPYAIIIRVSTFIHPENYIVTLEEKSGFIHSLYQVISNSVAQSIIALVLVFIQAIFLNRIAIKNRLSFESSLFSAVVYIILTALVPDLARFTPILVGNLFMLMALYNLFSTYKKPNPTLEIFNSGFFIALAAVLHPIFIFYFLFGYIALLILGSFKLIRQLQYLSGILVGLYLFYGFIFYFSDIALVTFEHWTDGIGFFKYGPISIIHYITLGFYGFLFLFAFLSYNSYGLRKSIQVQKKIDILYWYVAISILGIFFLKDSLIENILILSIPLSLLIGMSMSTTKQKIILEMIHLLVLGLIFISHFVL